MPNAMHGVIHGKTIQLHEDPGLAEGQEVEVRVQIVSRSGKWGEGINRSAGGWVDHAELDAVMDKIQQERKLDRRAQTDGQ